MRPVSFQYILIAARSVWRCTLRWASSEHGRGAGGRDARQWLCSAPGRTKFHRGTRPRAISILSLARGSSDTGAYVLMEARACAQLRSAHGSVSIWWNDLRSTVPCWIRIDLSRRLPGRLAIVLDVIMAYCFELAFNVVLRAAAESHHDHVRRWVSQLPRHRAAHPRRPRRT